MAHFALIDDNNIVQAVNVISNDTLGNTPFPESEPLGQAFLAELGLEGVYMQCSYNGAFRGLYPGIGWIWNPDTEHPDGGEFTEPTEPVAEMSTP